MHTNRFETRAPSNQTALDIFEGTWTTNFDHLCDVTNTGSTDLLNDGRIRMAADYLGINGRFDGYTILELGPLEAAQTYQLSLLNPLSITSIEASSRAFLKCLTLKEVIGFQARFLFGDASEFLIKSHDQYDLIFCSGLLYHLQHPLELIKQICLHSNRCFVWSHYFIPDSAECSFVRVPRAVELNGFNTIYYEMEYPSMDGNFLGGNRPTHAWLTRDEITRAFLHFGLSRTQILADEPSHVNGPAFSCAYSRLR